MAAELEALRQRKAECVPACCRMRFMLCRQRALLTRRVRCRVSPAPLRRSFASTSVGTSAAECALLCAVAPAGLALRRALAVLGAPRSGAAAAFLDFATLVAPTLGVRHPYI